MHGHAVPLRFLDEIFTSGHERQFVSSGPLQALHDKWHLLQTKSSFIE